MASTPGNDAGLTAGTAEPAPAPRRADAWDLDFTREVKGGELDIIAAHPRAGAPANGVAIVVDPNPEEARRTAAALREAGFHAVTESSVHGLARHIAMLGPPQLLVLESDLAGVEGATVAESARASRRACDIAVVFYSNERRRPQVMRALKAGADGYVFKSPDSGPLLRAVRQVLGS